MALDWEEGKQTLLKVANRIKRRGFIDLIDLLEFEKLGYTPRRIIEELRRRGAKAYTFLPSRFQVSFYVGREKEYLIFPDVLYCSCLSKYPTNILRRRYCHHLICYLIAQALNSVEHYYIDDEHFDLIMTELREE